VTTPWQAPAGASWDNKPVCRCGRQMREGMCAGCYYPPPKCICITYTEIESRMKPGAVLLDEPASPRAAWGRGSEVLISHGEATVICGADGVGKTTAGGNLLRAQFGLGPGLPGQVREVLGYPVTPLAKDERVLYLAMDRPRQAKRALHRLFTDAEREVLQKRLVFWEGPPPVDLASDTSMLREMCRIAKAQWCYIDSLKDAAVGLSDDRVGAAWNRARQRAIEDGRELIELHHPRKATEGNPKPKSLDDVYGSRWITAGAGSVIFLWGKAGDAVVELFHLKPPAEEVPHMLMTIDPVAGTVSTDGVDGVLADIGASGVATFTAATAARIMFKTVDPTKNEIEKARRRLQRWTADGKMTTAGTGGGRGHASTWQLAPGLGLDGLEGGFLSWWRMADGEA
jgi:hypothetical protein